MGGAAPNLANPKCLLHLRMDVHDDSASVGQSKRCHERPDVERFPTIRVQVIA